MDKEISKEKILILIICTILLLVLSFTSAMIYSIFILPTYKMQYANLFFVISFVLIFSLIATLYHVWMTRIQSYE